MLQGLGRHRLRRQEGSAHPTRMLSSMSVGATLSPRPTTNCTQREGILNTPAVSAVSPSHWHRNRMTTKQVTTEASALPRMTMTRGLRTVQGGDVQCRACTFAICLTLMTYLASSAPGLMIFVHRATCTAGWHLSRSRTQLCRASDAGLSVIRQQVTSSRGHGLWGGGVRAQSQGTIFPAAGGG